MYVRLWVDVVALVMMVWKRRHILDDDVWDFVNRSGVHVGWVWHRWPGRWLGDCGSLQWSKWIIGGFQWDRVCRRS